MNGGIVLAVAAGGAVGATARYLVMSWVGHAFGHGFPYGTLAVNVLGSFVLGALIEVMALTYSPSEEVRAFLVVGMLGAFTTFSAFSLDVVTLFQRGEPATAGIYVALSVFLSVLAFIAGLSVLRWIVS
jgi:CrcB protein